MTIRFYGAAHTVTGSKFFVEAGRTRVLVDCGLFQGLKELRRRNWEDPPVEPSSVDAVLLTHAHIDHSGYLPRFVKQGFQGPIYCTRPTRDLARILLPDCAYLQEEDARYANRKGFSKHEPALPLYTQRDAERVFPHLKVIRFGEEFEVGDVAVEYAPAGHILGAASVRLRHGGRSLLFSGDLGRRNDPLMPAPAAPLDADWIVMESTYGDELHEQIDVVDAIEEVMEHALSRGGCLLVPSFAVARAQLVLYCVEQVFRRGKIPRAPVYLDSPMATDVSELYVTHHEFHRLSLAFSAHADQKGLLAWLREAPRQPRTLFLVHGEPTAADELRRRCEEEFRLPVHIPSYKEKIVLE